MVCGVHIYIYLYRETSGHVLWCGFFRERENEIERERERTRERERERERKRE